MVWNLSPGGGTDTRLEEKDTLGLFGCFLRRDKREETKKDLLLGGGATLVSSEESLDYATDTFRTRIGRRWGPTIFVKRGAIIR